MDLISLKEFSKILSEKIKDVSGVTVILSEYVENAVLVVNKKQYELLKNEFNKNEENAFTIKASPIDNYPPGVDSSDFN